MPHIEAAVEEALRLDEPTALARAAVAVPSRPGHMPLEVVLHLVREAHRAKKTRFRDRLIEVLFGRCAALLVRAIPVRKTYDATTLRDEVIARFAEVVAKDMKEEGPLDFYEIQFQKTFAVLRVRVLLKERQRRRVFDEPQPFVEPEEADPDALSPDEQLASLDRPGSFVPGDQEQRADVDRFARAVAELPPEEREAVTLCHLLDLDVESVDPTKRTAATVAGVSGRTIRERLRRAATRLQRFQEES
jgi:hypothetical protein